MRNLTKSIAAATILLTVLVTSPAISHSSNSNVGEGPGELLPSSGRQVEDAVIKVKKALALKEKKARAQKLVLFILVVTSAAAVLIYFLQARAWTSNRWWLHKFTIVSAIAGLAMYILVGVCFDLMIGTTASDSLHSSRVVADKNNSTLMYLIIVAGKLAVVILLVFLGISVARRKK